MSLMRLSSPHSVSGDRTGKVMLQVAAATIPGVLALVLHFGIGVLINILLCTVTAFACEAAIMKVRKRPVLFYLRDYSALVTALVATRQVRVGGMCPWGFKYAHRE